MHYFSQSSIFCVHPSAAAGLRQDFVNDKNGEILLCVTLPSIKEMRSAGASGEPTVSEGTASMCHLHPLPAVGSLSNLLWPSAGARGAFGAKRPLVARIGAAPRASILR